MRRQTKNTTQKYREASPGIHHTAKCTPVVLGVIIASYINTTTRRKKTKTKTTTITSTSAAASPAGAFIVFSSYSSSSSSLLLLLLLLLQLHILLLLLFDTRKPSIHTYTQTYTHKKDTHNHYTQGSRTNSVPSFSFSSPSFSPFFPSFPSFSPQRTIERDPSILRV